MRVAAIVNQKGGCGKTTTAVNLSALLAREGSRTLLVDMDPQSHCAAGLGVPDHGIERTIADALLCDQSQPPRASDYLWEVARNLMLAPSSVSLAALEAPNGPLASRLDRDRRLARVLAAWQDQFDWCIVDCPPTIGLLSFNALRAADIVIIPVETGYFSLKGAEKQAEMMRTVSARFGREIPFHILPTLVNDSRSLSRDVLAQLGKRFADSLLPFAVHEHDELREAASYGQAITEFAPTSAAAEEFTVLAQWLQKQTTTPSVLLEVEQTQLTSIETFAAVTMPAMSAWSASAVQDPTPSNGRTHGGSVNTSATDVAVSQRSAAAANTSAPVLAAPGRAADLVMRLRALADRSRQAATVGGGFGVRVSRNGIALFSQPSTPRALSVIGDFNDWNPHATPLLVSADGTRLEAAVTLAAGRHCYRIVVDGIETLDEFNLHRRGSTTDMGVNLIEVPEFLATHDAFANVSGSEQGGQS